MLRLVLLLPPLLFLFRPAAAETTKTCIVRVGDHTMDLTPLASQFSLEYQSPDGRHTYLATLCGAAPVLGDACKVTDAVAGSKSACEVYGRASQAGKPTFLDHSHPQHGMTITYAGGSRCASPLSPSYSTTFNFVCDKSPSHPPAHKALVSVDEEPTSCRFSFVFRHPACCPIFHPSSPAADDDHEGGPLSSDTTLSAGAVSLFLLVAAIICLVGYCGVGGVYKARVRGRQGLEALPHVDQLRRLVRGIVQHVYRPISRLVGLPTEEADGGEVTAPSSGDHSGAMMKTLRVTVPRSGRFSPHAMEESMVALSGREALLSQADVEEEVAL